MAGPRVSGGIFDNVVAQGSLRFFKLSSAALGYFEFTIGTGAVTLIPGSGEPAIANGKPVPGSVADRVFRTIMENCTVVLISIIDDDNIHFICENEGFVWGVNGVGGGADQGAGGTAAAEMLIAIKALGVIGGGAIGSLNSPIPDDSASGVPTRDLDVNDVTLVEVDFDIVA